MMITVVYVGCCATIFETKEIFDIASLSTSNKNYIQFSIEIILKNITKNYIQARLVWWEAIVVVQRA